jgi:hypothetical protein
MSPRARKPKPQKILPTPAQLAQIRRIAKLEKELDEFINDTTKALGSLNRTLRAAKNNPYGRMMCPFYGNCGAMPRKPPKKTL